MESHDIVYFGLAFTVAEGGHRIMGLITWQFRALKCKHFSEHKDSILYNLTLEDLVSLSPSKIKGGGGKTTTSWWEGCHLTSR